MRCLFYMLLGWFLICCFQPGAAHSECAAGKLSTILYQPWQVDVERSDRYWNEKAVEIQSAGYSTVLLQWSAYGEHDFVSAAEPSFLTRFLDIAAEHNLSVIVGLWSDPAWFSHIREDAQALEFYLRKVRAKHLALARTIMDSLQDHPAVIGWYLPEEIDDREWRAAPKQLLLQQHLQETAEQLKELRPGLPIMISSFFAGFMTPKHYSSMLARLQQETGLVWLIQDGLGTGRLTNVETGRYMRAFTEKATGGTLVYRGVLELFSQVADGSGFVAASPLEITARTAVWCENTQKSPDISFSLRYRFPFAEEKGTKVQLR